ncbi:MAG: DUF2130 domain-containing protein [Armatimonadetes bacterium]|nr:DUF2130 domain-containing protein [Armatimonadota bacterium]
MPTENTIKCPECGFEIPLTETLAGPLLERAKAESQKLVDAERRKAEAAEAALAKGQAEIATERANLEKDVAEKLAAKRPEYEATIRQAVKAEMAADVKSKEQENEQLRASLKESQNAQLEAIKAKNEAEQKAATVDLEVAKRVAAETATIQADATKTAHEAEKLNQAALQKKLDEALSQVETMKRKIEQGSQQAQGELAEATLQEQLSAAFPWDAIEEVPTGTRGADILQRVMVGPEAAAGSILWESKNTQNWGGDWLTTAKRNQRSVKADLVVIVSRALPKGVQQIDCCEDVWVVSPSHAISIAKALRTGIVETANARRTAEGRKTNAENAYDYLMGPEFTARIKGIGEPFRQMEVSLARERDYMTSKWSERQKLIELVREAAFGMHGDIEALLGKPILGFEAIEALALVAGPIATEEVSQ